MYRHLPKMMLVGITSVVGPAGWAATVDFQLETLGTQYGTPPPNLPGDVVLWQNDIHMSVENFTLGAFTGFNVAEIAVPPASFFPPAVNPTQALTTNNINAKFDFTALGFDVDFVSLEYADVGGEENFEINTTGRQEVGSLTSLAPIPGFNVNVTSNPISGGVDGVVEITALAGNRIESLLIGGQEFTIDNLNAIPEPSSSVLFVLAFLGLLAHRIYERQAESART